MAIRRSATTEEVWGVLIIAGLIAGAISYYVSNTQATAVAAEEKPAVVFVKPKIITQPVFSDVGPGWGSGRWLGHGDFIFRRDMDHPYGHHPSYAGHPAGPGPLPQAPPMFPISHSIGHLPPPPPPGMPAFGSGPSA
jgi:hypothetical protein